MTVLTYPQWLLEKDKFLRVEPRQSSRSCHSFQKLILWVQKGLCTQHTPRKLEKDIEKPWFLDVFGCFWMFLDVFGCFWMFLDVFGCFWMFLDVFGCFWMFLVGVLHFNPYPSEPFVHRHEIQTTRAPKCTLHVGIDKTWHKTPTNLVPSGPQKCWGLGGLPSEIWDANGCEWMRMDANGCDENHWDA